MCHAPAVAIGAHVGRGGEKRAHYGRLRRLQFHPVEATGDAIAGNKGEPCENLGDVRVVDSLGTSRNNGSATALGANSGDRE